MGYLPTKTALGAGHLKNFLNAPGMPGGLPGEGMLAAGIDSHITRGKNLKTQRLTKLSILLIIL